MMPTVLKTFWNGTNDLDSFYGWTEILIVNIKLNKRKKLIFGVRKR